MAQNKHSCSKMEEWRHIKKILTQSQTHIQQGTHQTLEFHICTCNRIIWTLVSWTCLALQFCYLSHMQTLP